MTEKKIYSVLIIGLGNIGMGYDIEDKTNKLIISHAKSFNINEKFNLVGGVDKNLNIINKFKEKYKCECFNNVKEGILSLKPDIVVIATPTKKHLVNLREILDHGQPKIIICEKPLSYQFNEAQEIINLCKKNEVKIFINYFRRVLPGNLAILSLLNSNKIQTPFRGVCIYSKGLFNGCSHFINLMQFLFGNVQSLKIINKNEKKYDPEPDFELEFKQGNIIFISNKNDSVFINNAELIMHNGKLNFENSGEKILWKPFIKDKRYKGYKILGETSKVFENDFDRIQSYVAEQIHNAIVNKKTYLCNGVEALNTQKVMEEIKLKL